MKGKNKSEKGKEERKSLGFFDETITYFISLALLFRQFCSTTHRLF